MAKTRKEIREMLMKNGAVERSGLVVKKITVCDTDYEGTRLAVTFKEGSVPGRKVDANGDYVKDEVVTIYMFSSQLNAVLSEVDGFASICNHLAKHPDAYTVLLEGATMTVLAEDVKATDTNNPKDKGYHNPFSTKEDTYKVMKHDTTIHHPYSVKPTKQNFEDAKAIKKFLLGIG